MSNSTLNLTPDLYDYLLSTSLRESQLLKALREETAKDSMSRMQIAPEQGQFMHMLVKLMGARKILEVGTYTGYSSIVMAQAMVQPAQLICCDVSEEWTNIAKRYWKKAGVESICDLRIAPAKDTMQALLNQGQARRFDLIFIDADKEHYQEYYELALRLLRSGGLIVLDNTLWSGKVADPTIDDVDTIALRQLNELLKGDQRIDLSHLPIADGLTLCRKR